MSLDEWEERVDACVARLARIDLGFPQGKNGWGPRPGELHKAELAQRFPQDSAGDLLRLLQRHDGATFPDVHNGYFIHSNEQLLASAPEKTLVFGSDGGGGSFALSLTDAGTVYHRPPLFQPVPVSSTFMGFLERLLGDVEAFVNGTPRVYMSDLWKASGPS